jgi:hypothetical protein
MPGKWRLRNLMAWVAILAIYLAAFRLVASRPSDDPWTALSQRIARVLLVFVMPFHVISAWSRAMAGHAERCDP